VRLVIQGYLSLFASSRVNNILVFPFHAELRHIVLNFIADDGDHSWACVLFCDPVTGDGPSNRVACHPFLPPTPSSISFSGYTSPIHFDNHDTLAQNSNCQTMTTTFASYLPVKLNLKVFPRCILSQFVQKVRCLFHSL
jgi:hypothetical protein